MSKVVITGDIHLDHNPEHEYRWQVFDTLEKHLFRSDVEALLILGDLVDAKDRHPAAFVNRVVSEIAALAEHRQVVLLKGNHDYVDPKCPFFGFLDTIPGVQYVIEPEVVRVGSVDMLMLPHGTDWKSNPHWRTRISLAGANGNPWNLIGCHETFEGSRSSNGTTLDGLWVRAVKPKVTGGTPVIAGDIHVPQTLGNITYVGSPHRVRFGDTFEPRILLWDTETQESESIAMGGIKRSNAIFTSSDEGFEYDVALREGDHIKARFHGSAADIPQWPTIREQLRLFIAGQGARCFGAEFVLQEGAETAPGEAPGPEPLQEDPEAYESYCEVFQVEAAMREAGKKWL